MYRTLHSKAAEHTFLSTAHGTFSRIDSCQSTKQVSADYNHIKHFFWLWGYETLTQLQEKKEKHKHIEAKQNDAEQPKGHWRNQREN